MHRHLSSIFKFFLISILLFGCALPREERVNQSFVPDKELFAANLVKEGLNYYGRSRYVEAEMRFQQALYLFPNLDGVKQNLAVVLEDQGRFEEARDIYLELRTRKEGTNSFLLSLGRVSVRLGQYTDAEDYFQQGFDMAWETADWGWAAMFARSLSSLYFRLGDEERANCYSGIALDLKVDVEEAYRHSRLLAAMHLVGANERLLDKFLAMGGVFKGMSLVSQRAEAHLAKAQYQEAFDSAKESMMLTMDRPEAQFETRLALLIADRLRTKTPEEIEKAEENADETAAHELEILLDPRLDGSNTLYWPLKMLDDLAQIRSEIPPEELES